MERLMHPRSTEQSGKLCLLPLVVPSFSPLFLFVATSVQWPHFFSAHNSTGQTSSVGAQPSEPFWKCQHLWSHRSVTSSYRLYPARYRDYVQPDIFCMLHFLIYFSFLKGVDTILPPLFAKLATTFHEIPGVKFAINIFSLLYFSV